MTRRRPSSLSALSSRNFWPARAGSPKSTSPLHRRAGWGGGIGQWLVFRSAARDLCLFALVVPPGAATPVHNHLA
ncbi:MAG TPA: hypothetical protein VNA27_17215 [Rubrobacteraceae bacterium]|nr:hypothetical protein [Rubrobacteraceae bacterium]